MTENKKKSDAQRAFVEDGELKTHVGGQALIEGIMMRGRYNWSVAVREPDNNIYLEEHDLASGKKKNGWLYWPIVRGCRAFVESLALGYKALTIAAEHAYAEEVEDSEEFEAAEARAEGRPRSTEEEQPQAAAEQGGLRPSLEADQAESLAEDSTFEEDAQEQPFSWKNDFGNPDEMIDALGAQRTLEVVTEPAPEAPAADKPAPEKEPVLSGAAMTVSMIIGVVMGIALFIVVPAAITNFFVGEYDDKTLLWNIVDGILRIAIFVFYIWLIGRMQDIKRMFGYHGAEHKTIHCYEHGLPLTPENARSFPRLHVRCGTAFLIMVMIIAIFVYTIVPVAALIQAIGVPEGPVKLLFVILTRIILMPIIAGVSYEITVKWAGTHPSNPLVKVILWPGLQMQRLTTNEPDDGQIECAIAAMQLVLEREEAEAAKAGGTVGDMRSDGATR